ncbi:MAG: gliding motility protein GldL [Prevotella sp.]|nr:gliding motility protein GldL [Prevotella sp.]
MTQYSKYNVVYRLQKWMDSVPGQTFLNYAYSWGASIVILGTLFKLTHMDGADFFLFLGMGTEVFVFFISAFDRPFDKSADGMDLPTHIEKGNVTGVQSVGTVAGSAELPEGVEGTDYHGPAVIGGGPTVIGGGGTVIIGGGGGQAAALTEGAEQATVDTEAIAAVSSSVTTVAGGIVTPPVPVNPELEEATSNYVDELKNLTEMLHKVSEQSERLSRDSEEMENLNRTLTGICKIYEMQLKGASQQIGTIDEINEQTKRMADQIAELNQIYARMIEAMTVNMPKVGPQS